MTDRSTSPRCGNNPNARLTDGDRKAVADFKARLALKAAAVPYIDAAVWVDGDPLMETIALTLWERCARDDPQQPQAVCDDPRTIAAFAVAVARAHASMAPAPVDRAAVLREAATIADRLMDERYGPDCSYAIGGEAVAQELRRLAEAPQPETQGGHVCKPGAATYFCPTSGETESGCHGGFGVCCDRPELHAPAVVAQPGKEADRIRAAVDGTENPTPPASLRRSDDACPGFPERCPNLRTVEPNPPVHLGGIRCGCADAADTSP